MNVPGLELYDATGSSKRTQNDFPAGMFSQLAWTGFADAKARQEKQRKARMRPTPQAAKRVAAPHLLNSLFNRIRIPATPQLLNQPLLV
jgi:hypothetical protein